MLNLSANVSQVVVPLMALMAEPLLAGSAGATKYSEQTNGQWVDDGDDNRPEEPTTITRIPNAPSPSFFMRSQS